MPVITGAATVWKTTLQNRRSSFLRSVHVPFSCIFQLIIFLSFVKKLFLNPVQLFEYRKTLFYFFLILNSVFLYSIYGVKLNKYLFGFIVFIISHAIIMNTIYGIPWSYFIKQTLGISFVTIYFYNVFVFWRTLRCACCTLYLWC